MPSTRRGLERRERLVTAAATLVAERGYHGVGVDEIGAAAGVTGAAVYRHFSGKQELLVELIERAVDALMGEARRIVANAPDPRSALRGLVDAHVDFALTETALIAVYDQEVHNLDEVPRRRLRRQQRAYAELWVDVLAELAAKRRREELTFTVHAVFGLLNSVADHRLRLGGDDGARTLAAMAHGALDAALC